MACARTSSHSLTFLKFHAGIESSLSHSLTRALLASGCCSAFFSGIGLCTIAWKNSETFPFGLILSWCCLSSISFAAATLPDTLSDNLPPGFAAGLHGIAAASGIPSFSFASCMTLLYSSMSAVGMLPVICIFWREASIFGESSFHFPISMRFSFLLR